ncbi:MAG: YgiT-type zinc finger protein [Clostridiaceae bacterium]|jgi:YgiT-type zinc finger domain-containing protein|nr:YgiT-type zinc finger protein [Clostridiaceae bacterium]
MRAVRCMFCDGNTTIHNINAQKRVRGKMITVTNAPVYYCDNCNETFLSKETQSVFRYIQDRRLDEKRILFNFDDMVNRLY